MLSGELPQEVSIQYSRTNVTYNVCLSSVIRPELPIAKVE